MSERQIELVWRCSSCRERNLGRFAVCPSCGNPKDDSEEYEMPADPSAVASVQDPELLRIATGGENWTCAYCRSHQRAADGGCAQCGAGRIARDVAPAPVEVPRPASRHLVPKILVGAFVALAMVSVVVGLRTKPRERREAVVLPVARSLHRAKVTSTSWSRKITVERWELVRHEAFATDVPPGAVDVRAAGVRHHHDEQVLDHEDTVWEDVEVPDGYRTESYTERVKCGEDCTTTPRVCRNVCSGSPRSCRQSCSNNKNGFATCKEVCTGSGQTCRDECSGGSRSCTTKYCDERRTKQVAKTRTERRSKKVPVYRAEPRNAPWSTYATWEWTLLQKDEASGDDARPRWPTLPAAPAAYRPPPWPTPAPGPKAGELRESRVETLAVRLAIDDATTRALVPASAEELARYHVGEELLVLTVGPETRVLR